MEKEFVPYEQALALKELGFDEPCFTYYWEDGVRVKGVNDPFNYNKQNVISAPLYQQAFRWFREKYGLCYTIHPLKENKTYEEAELACLIKLIEIVKSK